MLDPAARGLIDGPMNYLGRHLAQTGIGANTVSLAGLAIGLVAAALVGAGLTTLALLPLLVSRLLDGLDGAVARATYKTDFGGYLDIACDFAFYAALPFAFVILDPERNALAGAFLLMTFYVNGTSFLGYAILAEKNRMQTTARGEKTLYFSNGLLEGTETILFFVAICLFPAAFPILAWIFGALCLLTAALRVWSAQRVFPN